MQVVRMVLVGQVNRDVVGLVNAHGPFAVGLSGEDAQLFTAERRDAVVDGEQVDVGLVGEVVDVAAEIVHGAARRGQGAGRRHRRPRRSTARSTTSTPTPPRPRSPSRVGAEKLVVLTDVEGLYADWPSQRRGDQRDRRRRAGELLPGLSSGMVPKMEACLRGRARRGARGRTCSTAGSPHSLLLELFTDEGVGTMVVPA